MRGIFCRVDELNKYIGSKKIVLFGAGGWLRALECEIMSAYKNQISYIIDNKATGNVLLFGCEKRVCRPEVVKNETNCVIMLTSPIYMYDMYNQLLEMNLDDTVLCIGFPFLTIDRSTEDDEEVEKKILGKEGSLKIPKTIHSFWFSGEKKPIEYQRCVDSWKERCPDYEIYEWNQNNYDCKKHPFLKRAIELKMWAFATDFARLDKIYEMGGTYFDMDVEVLKPFDSVLRNEAFFSFCNNALIDFAAFGSYKNNPFIKMLLDHYDTLELPETREGFKKYYSLTMLRDYFVENGVVFNGKTQLAHDMVVLSPKYFMPLEHVVFDEPVISSQTFAIHYDNFGWGTDIDNPRLKKIEDNRKLRSILINDMER